LLYQWASIPQLSHKSRNRRRLLLEKTITRLANGTVKVEAKDGNNYQLNPDGSEHHWGKEIYDKGPSDYKNDANLSQAREVLNQAVADHVPADRQPYFKKDMADFQTA
jgi:hypothetical protein